MMAPEMRLHNLSPGTWHVNLIGKKTFADVMLEALRWGDYLVTRAFKS